MRDKDNPFSVMVPDEMTAEEANEIFVELHADRPEVRGLGNIMISGVRGCGKSMLIRCSLCDFIMIREGKKFSELPYLAVSLPVKKTELALADLQKLDHYFAPYMLNEHFLVMHVLMHTFLNLSKIIYDKDKFDIMNYKHFFENIYYKNLQICGCNDELTPDYSSEKTFFSMLYFHMCKKINEFKRYILNLYNVDNKNVSYDLPLFSYGQFLVPVFRGLLDLPGFPKGKKLLLFIDDADYLSEIQTQILNSWLVSRTQPTISIKVSAQEEVYKTFVTSTGVFVEAPHDFQEVDISPVYTTDFREGNYYKQAIMVLYKRLQLYWGEEMYPNSDIREMEKSLEKFFPYYEVQEDAIKMEAKKIKEGYSIDGRGYNRSDDIRRYAIPNYIRSLGGKRKATSTFRYAGLKNIIHLSSGNIRYLLDTVALMYSMELSENQDKNVKMISTNVQNRALRERAQYYLFKELRRNMDAEDAVDNPIEITDKPLSTADKLGNLINAMGKTFYDILVSGDQDNPFSGRAERKVFSIALSNPRMVDEELRKVFKRGVRLGFLQKKTIGTKSGGGRTDLYILNRCFAPVFGLDPTGFQGYLFVTNDDLRKAIYSGKQLKYIDKNEKDNEFTQLSISDFME
ncbi:MAG: hypothetical protein NC124_17885 [Clostridium sp.]|nr:hypothetical protein [Clostridium sp.]